MLALISLLTVSISHAQAEGCEVTNAGLLAQLPTPAVIVLGERRGLWPDLRRAEKLARKLARDRPVTVALQAVAADRQPILDRYAAGELADSDLPELLGWSQGWTMDYSDYQDLVAGADWGGTVLAVGHPYEARPADAVAPMPPGYFTVLLDGIGEHAMPVELEGPFATNTAWLDHRMAASAVQGWSGEGVLLILVDRLHNEGGLGVSWQVQQLTSAPVHNVLLAEANTPCYAGDLVWKDALGG